jgi:hypothetical protein
MAANPVLRYQLNQAAKALSTSWPGQPANPSKMVMNAGDFTALAGTDPGGVGV